MSANSIMNIGSLYFMDGTMQTTAQETDPTGKAIFNNGILVFNGTTTDTLHVTDASQLDGAVTMGSTLEVTDATTLNSTLEVAGTSQLDGDVTVGTNVAPANLEVTGTLKAQIIQGNDGPGMTIDTNSHDISIGSDGTLFSSVVNIIGGNNASSTDTVSTTIAALIVKDGGLFIKKDLMVYGGNIYGPSTGTLKIGGGTSVQVGVSEILLGNTYTLPPVKILTTTDATSPTDGALIVSGGVGIAKSCYALTFNSSSDYRIKEDVSELNDKFNVDKLRPVTYTNKNTKKQDIGFIAHEIQEEFPYLVSGEKDGEQMQSINYIGLIGVLVKEIQELKKRVSILENK